MRLSLILTVLNEEATLRPLLDSLLTQTRAPDEIVIADGGSTDGTLDILREYSARLPIRIVAAPHTTIAQGRNAAIRATTGDVIAVTDGGVRAKREWLEELTRPFVEGGESLHTPHSTLHATAGFFAADGDTPFDMAMGATVLPEAQEIDPPTYLPSSRSVAFRKEVWERVGGYPEWLDFSEDVVFDLNVRREFGPFVFAPEAIVHFRPRSSLRSFFKQYFQYARGDGKANLFPRLHAMRYLTYLVVAPLIAYAAIAVSPWMFLLYLVGGLAYVRMPYQRLWPRLRALSFGGKLTALLSVPLIRVVGDVAKMVGYPIGVAWRFKRGSGGAGEQGRG